MDAIGVSEGESRPCRRDGCNQCTKAHEPAEASRAGKCREACRRGAEDRHPDDHSKGAMTCSRRRDERDDHERDGGCEHHRARQQHAGLNALGGRRVRGNVTASARGGTRAGGGAGD